MKEYQIKAANGNCATILPEKGATLLSFQSNGIEMFYQDMENINSLERPRCGIPFLFPVFGRTPEDSAYPMEIHGFGHTRANEETRKVYPFEFCVELVFSIKDGKLNIHQIYENLGETDMPFSFGFHPYFAGVPTEFVTSVSAGMQMDMQTGQPAPYDGQPVQIYFPEGAPESGAFFVQAKDEVVFWAVRGKDFLCVEPINSSPNGLVTGDCYTLAPGEKEKQMYHFI